METFFYTVALSAAIVWITGFMGYMAGKYL